MGRDRCSEEEKRRRLQEIIRFTRVSSLLKLINSTIGQTVEVLVEGPAKRQEGWLAGKNSQFKTVVFPGNGAIPGTCVPVQVVSATAHTLIGKP